MSLGSPSHFVQGNCSSFLIEANYGLIAKRILVPDNDGAYVYPLQSFPPPRPTPRTIEPHRKLKV